MHPRFKSGRVITAKGYVRITSGPDRNKYEHRAVIEKLIRNAVCLPPGYTRDGIPQGMEIHHFDRNRTHNCPCNLQLVQDVIHHGIEKSKREYLAWYEKRRRKQGLTPLKHLPGFLLEKEEPECREPVDTQDTPF